MKLYILSLGAGLLVGIIYCLLNVRSPAPPLIALLGLLGMLVGEQVIPVGKKLLSGSAFTAACNETKATASVLGQLPGKHSSEKSDASPKA